MGVITQFKQPTTRLPTAQRQLGFPGGGSAIGGGGGGFNMRTGQNFGAGSFDDVNAPQVMPRPIAGQPQQIPNMAVGQLQKGFNQQPQVMPQQQQLQVMPQTGLSGGESALQGGLNAGIGAIQQGTRAGLGTLLGGFNQASDFINRGVSALGGGGVNGFQSGAGMSQAGQSSASQVDPRTGQPLFQQAAQGVGQFTGAGVNAQQQQAALSGAMGRDAQAQAFADFQSSPQQAFLKQQGQEAIINQASALGGLGGGNVQKELARFGTGLAAQDFENQFNRLGQLSGQGLQAAGQQGQFLSQAGQQQGNLAAQNAQLGTQSSIANAGNATQAGIANANRQSQLAQAKAGLFGQGANLAGNLAGQGAGFQFQGGQNAAQMFGNTGSQLANARIGAGKDIANAVQGTTSQLSNLINQQGGGLSDIIGQGGSNLANLLSGAGSLDANQQQQLAVLLANLSTGSGTQNANLQAGIGQAQSGGILGRAGAIGGTLGDIAGFAAGQF